MFEEFKARAEAANAGVRRFVVRKDAVAFILSALRQEGISEAGGRALWASGSFLDGLDRTSMARDGSISFEVTREAAALAKVGVSQMDYAIAETGTLVQACTSAEQRVVSMLPPVHIAIVPSSRILPDLRALLARMSPKDFGYLAFITGPSRTADIERVLTIGVHGPERLHVVCVDDL